MTVNTAHHRTEGDEQTSGAVLAFPLWRVRSEADALARVLVRLSPYDAATAVRSIVDYRTIRARAAGAAQADVEAVASEWVGYVRDAVTRTLADSAKQST